MDIPEKLTLAAIGGATAPFHGADASARLVSYINDGRQHVHLNCLIKTAPRVSHTEAG